MKSNAWSVSPIGIRVLYISSFLMNMGFYALIPYLTLYLTGSFAWSMTMAGILLGVRQFSQQGFTLVGGMVADRLGCKQTLVVGVIIRSIGFISFAFCTNTWQFFIAAIISGAGGALFEPSLQGAFARLTPEEHRKIIFSFKNVVANVGVVASTLMGSLLSSFDFFYLSLAAGFIYILVALLNSLALPNIKVEFSSYSWLQDIKQIVHNRPFVIYTIILIGYYYLYMQMFLTVPKMAITVTGNSQSVAYVYAAISLSVIAFQMIISKHIAKYDNRLTWIGIGAIVMGFGLFLQCFAGSILPLLLDVIVFSLGTMISGPLLMDVVPEFATKNQLASYYGFNGYSLALGGGLSTIAGGWFYDLGNSTGFLALPWIICLGVGSIVAWGLHALEGTRSRDNATSAKAFAPHTFKNMKVPRGRQ